MRPTIAAVAGAVAALIGTAPAGAAVHTVSPGETLSGIAALNGMSPATLAAANGLSPDALVIAGRALQIPAAGSVSSASAVPASTTSSAGSGGHLVVPGETLSGIAAANGLSTSALAAANGLSANGLVVAGRRLTIPARGTVAAAPSASSGVGSSGGHVVAPGETLSGIAAANGLSTASLAAANGLSPSGFVIAGRQLRIPARGTVAGTSSSAGGSVSTGTSSGGGHLVQPGETLSGIAAANGLSIGALAAANGLSPTSLVIAGTHMRIPARTAATTASSSAGSSGPPPMGGYTVQPGDTLSGLAARSRVAAAQIAYVNGLTPDTHLIAGRVLKLPTGSPALSSTSLMSPSSAVPESPSAPPVPTGTRVTSSTVGSIAAQNGVPPSLASAIAWQESGFNNGMVSSANARGVMQVMPGTWDWVQTYLAHQRLNPFSAEDNVRAGTLYLGHLLHETGGDPALAAAGYYQGLASVRQIGMLPETRRYVANVLALRSRFGG